MKHASALLLAAGWLLLVTGGCRPDESGERSEPGASADPGAAEVASRADGDRRLGREVVPRLYTLDLRIDPATDRFAGAGAILVEASVPTAEVVLHAEELALERVAVESPLGADPREVPHQPGENGALVLQVDPPLEGSAVLHFAWEGELPEEPYGLYRVREGDAWYAFTQFQPLAARRVFPSFDQPEFKTPYRVTLRVPKGQVALANAPVAQVDAGDEEATHVFRETKPLPTYLVAFAVGPFDVVDGAAHPPTRLVAARGKGELAAFALQRTPPILDWLVDYFDYPFPYAKLDLVAVPNFGAGAMENVGLVTFRERFLLLGDDDPPIWSRYSSQSIIAHELAHMWYGNLVTLAWWDDLWLNESFATWMASRALEDVDPELDSALDAIGSAQRTMELDSKRDARQIRQPIETGGDVYNAFDGITYGKGGAVLRMLESWLGEEAFRAGVRAYMRENAHGTGGTRELVAALEKASGKPVERVLERFLDQPGTPLVEAELRCEEGAPRLLLAQTRALPAASDAPTGEPWTIPVCVAFGLRDGSRSRECFLFDAPRAEVALPTEECPVWIHPNAGEAGYYRWTLPDEAWIELVDEHHDALETAELAALPGNGFAMLEAERLPVADLLDMLRVLVDHPKRHVSLAAVGALQRIYEAGVVGSKGPLAAAWGKEIRSMLGPELAKIGALPREGESAAARMKRGRLLSALAVMGRDRELRAFARERTNAFLARPAEANEEVLGQVLPIAARDGDSALYEGLLRVAEEPPSPVVRGHVVRSLGRFPDPALLRRSLGLVLDGPLRAQDYRSVAGSVTPEMRPIAWEWVAENYDRLADRLGPMTAGRLPQAASGLCSEEEATEVERFFEGVPESAPGTDRNLRLALEDIRRCAGLRKEISRALPEAIGAN